MSAAAWEVAKAELEQAWAKAKPPRSRSAAEELRARALLAEKRLIAGRGLRPWVISTTKSNGSINIERGARSPLAWPYDEEPAEKLEAYRRRLVRELVWEQLYQPEALRVMETMRRMRSGQALACCVDREVILDHADAQREQACHADVIWAVWVCMERERWQLPWILRGPAYVDGVRREDARELEHFEVLSKTSAALYELVFGRPMSWGRRGAERKGSGF